MYRQKLKDKLTLDSEGRPFRMLVFRGSPKSCRRSMRPDDEAEEFDNNVKQYCQLRTMPKVLKIRYQIIFILYFLRINLI